MSKKEMNLGRTGTPARFIREQYLKGRTTAQVEAAAVKKFPELKARLQTSPTYVRWYAWKMKKDGITLPAPKTATTH